jgi:hypothetical protein
VAWSCYISRISLTLFEAIHLRYCVAQYALFCCNGSRALSSSLQVSRFLRTRASSECRNAEAHVFTIHSPYR